MERKWWHEKTAYQIYPKSFRDSNGDGIGDLRGILEKLDYLRDLGVGILWISPVYRSPLADQGYDISDYYGIDPRFGTMEDMDALIQEAKARDIGVVMDLVVNHCSDEHAWFQAACRDPEGPYGKFFYIRDWQEGEPLPCNWRSYFGGPVWSPLPGHPDKVYLHLFHRKQPDLNWENPAVRQEIYKMIRWWLDKGLAGFRIDAIINIKKALPFRNYPADRPDGLCSPDRMLDDAQGVLDFLNEMADQAFRPYDAFTVGEVFNEKAEELPLFVGPRGCFSTIFDFTPHMADASPLGWYDQKPVPLSRWKEACFQGQEKAARADGFLCNILENHDEPRGVSRYLPTQTPTAKKLLGGLSFLLRGMPFLYQGQEIGMENLSFESIDQVDDVSSRDQYQVALDAGCTPAEALDALNRNSRDNARTPFQWDDSPSAGFTTGTPWLRVNPNYKAINLAAQQSDPESLWNFYRRLITLRGDPAYQETLVYGRTEPYLRERADLMAYFRRGQGQTLLVLGNLRDTVQEIPLPGSVRRVLLNNLPDWALRGNPLHAAPWQFAVVELTEG